MPRVRDLMTENVLWFSTEMPLLDAAQELSQRQVSAAPVCSPDGKVVGVLSKSDLVDVFGLAARESLVGDAMTPTALSVAADSPIEDAIRAMAFEGVHRLVVLDAEGRLEGVVSAMDVLRHLAGFPRRDERVMAVAPPADAQPLHEPALAHPLHDRPCMATHLTGHSVGFQVERPPRMARIHVIIRLALLLAIGAIGCSSFYWLLYLTIPAIAALLIAQKRSRSLPR
jgi:CBS domain-containing protein